MIKEPLLRDIHPEGRAESNLLLLSTVQVVEIEIVDWEGAAQRRRHFSHTRIPRLTDLRLRVPRRQAGVRSISYSIVEILRIHEPTAFGKAPGDQQCFAPNALRRCVVAECQT